MLPLQLIISIFLAFLLGNYLNAGVVAFFYTCSFCFIELLLFFLPLMVFAFIFLAIVNIKKNSLQLIVTIFCGVALSNALALYSSYFVSMLTLPTLNLAFAPEFFSQMQSEIEPLIKMELPKILTTEKAMILAFLLGLAHNLIKVGGEYKEKFVSGVNYLNGYIIAFLQKIFIPLLPFYVFGFCLKLSYDKALVNLFQSYGKVFLLSMALLIAYISLLYFFSAGGKFKQAWKNVVAMAPAGLTGFSTMSSAASLPVTLRCTKKTTQDKAYTDLVIPTTSNIHMLGDDLTIVMTAMTLMTIFGMPWPDLGQFSIFVIAFCIAKLSCVGIPGASVLVILPVLQKFLGFTPEMVTVLTTIYILQDPFGTAGNVMGNGAFALLVQRFAGNKVSGRTAVFAENEN